MAVGSARDALAARVRRQEPQRGLADDEELFFTDALAEYQWARDAAGLATSTLDQLTRPVIEVCEHYGVVPWKLTPRDVDHYLSGSGKRARSTVRTRLNRTDGYISGVPAAELCGVKIKDLHWESGQFGRAVARHGQAGFWAPGPMRCLFVSHYHSNVVASERLFADYL